MQYLKPMYHGSESWLDAHLFINATCHNFFAYEQLKFSAGPVKEGLGILR